MKYLHLHQKPYDCRLRLHSKIIRTKGCSHDFLHISVTTVIIFYNCDFTNSGRSNDFQKKNYHYTELASGTIGIVTEDLMEIWREESNSQYKYQKGQWIMTKLSNFTEKHGFFEKLICKTTSSFRNILVYLGQFKPENQNQ